MKEQTYCEVCEVWIREPHWSRHIYGKPHRIKFALLKEDGYRRKAKGA
jgi:hypothetical protein